MTEEWVGRDDWPDGTEAFGEFLTAWMAKFAAVIDALVILRCNGEDDAARAVVEAQPVAQLYEQWEMWEEDWNPVAGADSDTPLIPYLGESRMIRLWFAVWGTRVARAPDGRFVYGVPADGWDLPA